MRNPIISIIIPIYNVEKYLRRCLESCIHQTLQNIEIILVNDASPDKSYMIMEEYQRKYPEKIRCLYLEKNLRQGGARNRGLQIAKGDFILFVDSDDWIEPTMCEELYNMAIQECADIVYCDVLRETKSGYVINNRFDNTMTGIVDTEKTKELVLQLYVGPWAHIIRKKIVLDNKLFFPEGIIYEDTAIVRLWDVYANKIVKVEKPLYVYCLNLESVGQTKWSEYMDDGFRCIKALYDNLVICEKTKNFQMEREVICMSYLISMVNRLLCNYESKYMSRIEKDVRECINYIYRGEINKNVYWDYWYTPAEQAYLLNGIELQTYKEKKETMNEFSEYYDNLKEDIQKIVNWFKEKGKNKVAVWSKTNYAKGFCKIFRQAIMVDSLEEIEKNDIDVILCLRSLHMQNIKHVVNGQNVTVYNLQKYLFNGKTMNKYLWDGIEKITYEKLNLN